MTMPGEKPLTVIGRTNENRRASKPLMEKRRRARINHSLTELKTLILDAVKKEQQNTRHSKLEKADILEMTVKHLQNLHRQKAIATSGSNKFHAGFKECTKEVSRYVGRMEDVDPQLRSRLTNHLSRCLVNYQKPADIETHSEVSVAASQSPTVSSYSDGLQFPDRPDSAGPPHTGDYPGYCSSPVRPPSTASSSYKYHSSPTSLERGSRSSSPSSVQGYYVYPYGGVSSSPLVTVMSESNQYGLESNAFDNVRMDTSDYQRPVSPLNLVVSHKRNDAFNYSSASPSGSSSTNDTGVGRYEVEANGNCPNANQDDDSVWRPW